MTDTTPPADDLVCPACDHTPMRTEQHHGWGYCLNCHLPVQKLHPESTDFPPALNLNTTTPEDTPDA